MICPCGVPIDCGFISYGPVLFLCLACGNIVELHPDVDVSVDRLSLRLDGQLPRERSVAPPVDRVARPRGIDGDFYEHIGTLRLLHAILSLDAEPEAEVKQ